MKVKSADCSGEVCNFECFLDRGWSKVWSLFVFRSLFRCTMPLLLIINYFCLKKILFRNKKQTEKQCFFAIFRKMGIKW